MDADREIEDAFRDAEEFHPLRNAEDDPLSSSSDDAIALRFADRHASDLRFVAKWGQWLRHNGRQWRHDDTLHARDLARDVCRVSAEEFDYKTAVKIQSAKTISAVELLARADSAPRGDGRPVGRRSVVVEYARRRGRPEDGHPAPSSYDLRTTAKGTIPS